METNKNNINYLKSSELIENLSKEISLKFWIEKQKAIYLIQKDSITSLDSLKNELDKKDFETKRIEELFSTLEKTKKILEIQYQIERNKLKNEVEEKIDIDNFKNNLEWKLPRNLLKKAKSPEKLHEHILWASLWATNSIIASLDFLINLWYWIIKTPYDLYLILSWKAEIESIKKI